MTTPEAQPRIRWSLWLWLAVSLIAVLVAWGVPVNLRSVPLALLKEAGRGTPSVAEAGEIRLRAEKVGAARRLHSVSVALGDSGAARLGLRLEETERLRPEALTFGAWDPYLDSLMVLAENRGQEGRLPILRAIVPEKGRRALGAYLGNSRSLGVQQVLALREVPVTGRFVAVGKPGGQALESVLLLTALLYQADGLGAGLQREVREAVELATLEKRLGGLEVFLTDLLSLGSRMTWGELVELLRVTESVGGVGQLAQLAREAEENWDWIYAGSLLVGSSERVAGYVMERGKLGVEDLRAALERGQGAVR